MRPIPRTSTSIAKVGPILIDIPMLLFYVTMTLTYQSVAILIQVPLSYASLQVQYLAASELMGLKLK